MLKKIIYILVLLIYSSPAFCINLINQNETSHGFTINLPFGWEQIPETILEKYPSDMKFHYGFQESPGGLWFQKTPYILIGINDKERMYENEVSDINRVTKELEKEIESMLYEKNIAVKNHSIENVHYDNDNKVLHSELIITKVDARSFIVLTSMIMTEKGYINLLCFFDDKNDYDYYSVLFDQIVANIQLDDDLVFKSRFSDHFMFFEKWKKSFFNSPQNGLIILFILLGVWWSREKILGQK